MSIRVLIAPDKFKGSMTAREAAEAIAAGWRQVRSEDHLDLLPMSDGGDGFGQVISDLLQAFPCQVAAIDAARRPITATWWHLPAQRCGIIESARIIGLALLPPKVFHPFQLDTSGLGAVIRAAREAGTDNLLMGIGGSATNDGGFGAARAVGWKFLDRAGNSISQWTHLHLLDRIQPPEGSAPLLPLSVAVDVQNPLLGPEGASRIYGPQKGLRPEDMPAAEACLTRLAEIVRRDLRIGAETEPGTGAAGGLGYGLRCFFLARLESGFALFSRLTQLETKIRAAQLVVTGEGAIDRSTLMGKGVGQMALLSARCGVPCVGLAGSVNFSSAEAIRAKELFARVEGIAPARASLEAALREPQPLLARLASEFARLWES